MVRLVSKKAMQKSVTEVLNRASNALVIVYQSDSPAFLDAVKEWYNNKNEYGHQITDPFSVLSRFFGTRSYNDSDIMLDDALRILRKNGDIFYDEEDEDEDEDENEEEEDEEEESDEDEDEEEESDEDEDEDDDDEEESDEDEDDDDDDEGESDEDGLKRKTAVLAVTVYQH